MEAAACGDLSQGDAERARLRRQWVLARASDTAPAQFIRTELRGDLELWVHPDLRVTRHPGLVVLGLAYDALRPRTDVIEELATCAQRGDRDGWDAFERALECVDGTYVVLAEARESVRLYSDAAGMATVFYGAGRAASTPALLPGLERDPEVDAAFRLGGADDWYPGALTPFRGVRALLANHRLEVERTAVQRFWPRSAPAERTREAGVEECCELLRGAVAAAVARGPCLASLTGGRDSRVVLAAARECHGELDWFTIRAPGVKRCDLEAPAALASRFGIAHRFVDAGAPPAWLLELYDEISAGLVIGASREIADGCRQLAGTATHLNGNLGALTKSFFWDSRRPQRLDRRALAKEFVQRPPCVRSAIDEWVETLPELPPTVAYNLMYLEQRGARYMGIRETASGLYYASSSPFCSRRLFDAISGLPRDVQWGGGLLVEFVRQMWPELLDVPYCPVTRNWGTYLPKGLKQVIKVALGRA